MTERIDRIIKVLDGNKAENIQVFDMKDSDYFVNAVVIATTLGDRHGVALLDFLKTELKAHGETFLGVDDEGEWIVIDLGDMLIHLMSANYRAKYNIEDFLAKREEEMKKNHIEEE